MTQPPDVSADILNGNAKTPTADISRHMESMSINGKPPQGPLPSLPKNTPSF